jgi:hypothetical protein
VDESEIGQAGSTSGSRWCSRSTRSGMGSSRGGCRREAGAAAEVRQGGELGKRKSSANVGAGMREGGHWELKDTLQVEERAQRARAGAGGRRRAWRPWAELGQRWSSVARAGEDSGENQDGDRPGSNAWGLPKTGGGAGRAATTVSGDGEQLGWVAERRGKARRGQRGWVSGGRGVGAARGAQRGGTGAVKARHMAGEGSGAGATRNRGGEGLEVEDKGGSVIFQKYRDSIVKPR